ncbi:PadR family transcriptional regulator [Cellulomonas chitinilytica]|uniref:PadR family transcriptional regulator n=1 Tax=Cellulomonas chitinilytica TaxID=398759 RepID=A0A919U0D7_9CELL|nr:PadR family transcriptional regulator [Cellulomonas chitinilytica]GIG21848.1 PadR family transcriptional regulator [Cellulomonas chitinilytica]
MPAPVPAAGSSQGSSTRLLVLGCVRIFQPVHGYFLRRELLSWEVDQWAHVHPGSIYHALKSLTKAGLLDEVPTPASDTRPARTAYRLTPDGEREFLTLLRVGLLSVDDPTLFMTAINMAPALARDEVLGTLTTRVGLLEAAIAYAEAQVEQIVAAPDVPDSASEVARILAARLRGELVWARDYLERVGAGAYSFVGEPPTWTPTQAQVDAAREAGVGVGVIAAGEPPFARVV